MDNLKGICLNYFERFEAKDLSALSAMFARNVSLRDWEIKAEGKEAVLVANKKIFAQANTIQVSPKHIYQEGRIVIAEIEVVIDNSSVPLKVVDVISFDESNCICNIRSYRG